MRINKFLACCGLGSRRSVENFISSGKISVNGRTVTDLSTIIGQNDVVEFNGKLIAPKQYKYYCVYKPIGYTSTNNDIHAERVISDLSNDLIGLSIVGRLDKMSEGLVLLSNDGDFIYKHQHPSNLCEKEYLVDVKLSENITSIELERIIRYFSCGTKIDGYRTRPARIKLLGRENGIAKFNIILTEGRKRQIREIFDKEKIKVVKLKRVRIGIYTLGNLEPGDVAPLDLLDI